MSNELNCVYEASADWLEIAYPLNEGGIDWEAEPLSWTEIQELAESVGENPDDEELGSSLLVKPRDCDQLLPGDIVLTTGPGGNVYFFRKEAKDKIIAEILKNNLYLPDSGVILGLSKAMGRLSLSDLQNLATVVNNK